MRNCICLPVKSNFILLVNKIYGIIHRPTVLQTSVLLSKVQKVPCFTIWYHLLIYAERLCLEEKRNIDFCVQQISSGPNIYLRSAVDLRVQVKAAKLQLQSRNYLEFCVYTKLSLLGYSSMELLHPTAYQSFGGCSKLIFYHCPVVGSIGNNTKTQQF